MYTSLSKKLFFKTNFQYGFTLAEVLVTLAIIGVVASLTIPSLVKNVQNDQYKTAWKKNFSIFTQAANEFLIDNQSFLGVSNYPSVFKPYLNIVKTCTNSATEGCWHPTNETFYLNGTIAGIPDNNPNKTFGGRGFILSDGTLVTAYDNWNPTCVLTTDSDTCGWIVVDVNGFKGPDTIGKDIFGLWVGKYQLKPMGSDNTWPGTWTCSGTGWGCSSLYLTQ